MELQQRYYVNVNALTSQTRAMTVEAEARPRRKLRDRADAEPTITRPNRGRGTWFETEAAGCRGRDATDKKTVSRQARCLEDYTTDSWSWLAHGNARCASICFATVSSFYPQGQGQVTVVRSFVCNSVHSFVAFFSSKRKQCLKCIAATGKIYIISTLIFLYSS